MNNKVIANIQKIQRELNVCKKNKNNFGNYSYRNIEEIMQAIKPLLDDGIICYLSEELVVSEGDHYIKSKVIVTDGITNIEACSFAREPKEQKGMSAAQITGATTSYARKYAMGGMFLIDDNKDFDSLEIPKEKKTSLQGPNNLIHETKNNDKFHSMTKILIEEIMKNNDIPVHKWDIYRNYHKESLKTDFPYYFKIMDKIIDVDDLLNYLRGLL